MKVKLKRTGAARILWDGRKVQKDGEVQVTKEQADALLLQPGWERVGSSKAAAAKPAAEGE